MPQTIENTHKKKMTFESIRDARRAMKRIKAQSGYTLDIYKCVFCNFYHLGNNTRKIEPIEKKPKPRRQRETNSPDDYIYGGKYYEGED